MATPREMYPGMAIFSSPNSSRTLKPGDVVKQFDGTFHYIEYVNSSGAYAVPLAAVHRTISGRDVAFSVGGKTISATAIVEVINPLSMGGNSQEYLRYVRIVSASREGGMAKKKVDLATAAGATFGEFDDSDIDTGSENIVGATFTSSKEAKDMAKKAAKAAAPKAAQKVAKIKVPKTVRACACGCGGQTTGNFAPGHDARLHGWLKKLADGRMEPKELPAGLAKKLTLVATKTGHKATTPHFYKDA